MTVKSKEDLFPIVSSPMLEYQQQSVDRKIKLFASSINQVLIKVYSKKRFHLNYNRDTIVGKSVERKVESKNLAAKRCDGGGGGGRECGVKGKATRTRLKIIPVK